MSIFFLRTEADVYFISQDRSGYDVNSLTYCSQKTSYVTSYLDRQHQWRPPMAQRVYNQPVQTNNDVEGWHCRLNRKAQRVGINIYLLFTLIYQEAQMVEVKVRLLSDNKVRRAQRKSAVNGQMKLHKFWQEYRDGTRSISRLLSACARLYAPNPSS